MTDQQAMELALQQARAAAEAGEVPVGAVVLQHGEVIGTGRNAPIGLHDPTAHAEVLALRAAARHLGNYRLDGCELFVTLEPCAMCVGAALQARLSRVVFGASEPRSGAAGSVLDLFAQSRLNPHTNCIGGVLAAESQALLLDFFQHRRMARRAAALLAGPLRDDALRTPPEAFDGLPGFPWRPRHVNDLPALAGLRLLWIDEGPPDAALTWVCLHGPQDWSYRWRHHIPTWLAAGHRVLAIDLIGFGKSDKPKRDAAHRFAWHSEVLQQWIDRLDLRDVVLAVPDADSLLGLSMPPLDPGRFRGVLVANSRALAADVAAWAAPFPDAGHQAGPRRFAAAGFASAVDRAALTAFWRGRWQGQTMVADGGSQAPLFGRVAVERMVAALTGTAPIEPSAMSAEAIAQAAVGYFAQ